MTVPFEKVISVKNAREFLFELLDPKKTPKVPKSVRKRAYQLLKHFPSDFNLKQIQNLKHKQNPFYSE
jgi:hypothetical protein